MPAKDKLRGLLAQKERKVPDVVRLKEMNEVRNYNRNQFQKVFDLEKQQVSREQESIQPDSAKDVGAAFKLQVYILKINQVLQLKQETFQQLSTAIIGQPIAKLRGVRNAESALATSFFSKAELLSSFNEMMAFIKLYMPDLLQNNRQKEQVYSAYLTPLENQLKQVQRLYPTFFGGVDERGIPTLPRPRQGNAANNDREVFEQVRQQCLQLYALLGTMAEFLDDGNLRPVNAQDVSIYIKENNVRQIFISDIVPPINPNIQANIDFQQQLLAQQQAAAAAQAAELAQRQAQGAQAAQPPPPQPAPAQPGMPVQGAVDYNSGAGAAVAQVLRAQGLNASQNPAGIPLARAIPSYVQQITAQGNIADADILRATRFNIREPSLNNAIRYVANRFYGDNAMTAGIRQFKAQNPQYKTPAGRRPGGLPAPQPPQQPGGQPAPQPPAPQPAGPAQPAAAQDLRAHSQGAEVVGTGDVAHALNAQGPERALIAKLVPLVKRVELAQRPPKIMSPNKPADIQEVLGEIQNNHALQNEMDAVIQGGQDQVNFIRRILTAFRDTRAAYAQTEARDAGVPAYANQQNTLYGQGLPELKAFVDKKGMFPSKKNAKHVAHFMKLGIPPDAMFKLMKHHGIRDGALAEEMEGSGIFDSLKDMAKGALNSVKDNASGWASTIKNNLPDMSDVRRAVGKILPDSVQKHLPDGLKQTFGDKAKNFFGFGPSEAGGISTRHREPFSAPNLDKYGYKQGAAERMRTMPVDLELVGGLHRLTGGDQLRDTDPEVLRRADHHDVIVPVSHDQPLHGYGRDGDEDDQLQGGLKGRLRGMPYSMFAPRGGQATPFLHMFSGGELDPYADAFEGGAEGHYEEEEKPHDHDEDPTPFRVRNENHAVNTGKMKKVSYKE